LALFVCAVVVGAGLTFSAEAPAGPGFTAAPTFEKIPRGPIKGAANGRPFEAKAVYFEVNFGKWDMVIADQPLDKPTGFLKNAQYVNLTIPEPPAAGTKFTRKMAYGDGFFQIMQEKPDPTKTTSWNSENAWVVEFTKWDAKPYDKNGSMFQQGGAASGRVYAVYKGSDDAGRIKSSWVAGEFTDAPIRYMGEPEFKYETPKTAAPVTPAPPVAPAAVPAAPSAAAVGYTEAPSLDKIPNATIAGVVNGQPFAPKAVYFEPSGGKWSLVVADQPLPGATDLPSGAQQQLTVEFPEPPAAGKKLTKALDYGDGDFQITNPDEPKKTMNWNAMNAYAIEITKWDVKPYDEAGEMFQVCGKASGRIYVVYHGEPIKDSWVAGVFTDVPVRYMGKPELGYK
jgi:hypothetical protein